MGIILKNASYEILSDDGALRIINNLSFEFKEKKITFVLGESGSGKSLLLSLINGDDNLTSGDIVKDEIKSVQILRQNPEDYFFCNTIYEEILFRLKKRKISNINYDKKIISALKMVGLDDSYLRRSPFEISKGEQKKVAIAIVLACNPRVLILDEPFTNLDSSSKKKLIKLFRMMKLRYGKTFIIATNDTDIALELADEVICLKDGNSVFEGDKFDLFTNTMLLNNVSISKPDIIRFTDLVKKNKGINLGYRDDLNDLMKDIYRFVK